MCQTVYEKIVCGNIQKVCNLNERFQTWLALSKLYVEALGWPSHYRFLYNPQMNQIAVQVCSATDAGAHRVGKLNELSSCEIKCVAFVRMVYKNAKWDKRRSYRMIGNLFPEQRLVSFQIQEALPIENGKVLDGTVSPTFALCRAEGSPSQNNPTPEEKADSGEM